MKKFSLIIMIIMLVTLLPANLTFASEADNFGDVASDYFAKDAIYEMAKRGIVQGISSGYFGTQENITREQLAKVLCKLFNIEPVNSEMPLFTDVAKTSWSYGYTAACKDFFYINEGKFEPGRNAAREEVAFAVVKALKYGIADIKDKEILSKTFKDFLDINIMYQSEVAVAFEKGIIRGYEDSTFRPKNPIKRGEAMQMLFNITKAETKEVKKDPRGVRAMDVIMLYDMDHGASINSRPDRGWWTLNPEYPADPVDKGHFRVTTPLLGTYDSSDPKVVKQHLYWLAALGCNALQSDFTNWRSIREPNVDNNVKGFFNGISRAFETQLKVISQITEFDPPKAYGMMRLNGSEFDNLQLMLNDVYAFYEKYPDSWYKFDDGSDRKDKPFLVIFADWNLLGRWTATGIPFDDERFNIRWSNGFLSGVQGVSKINDAGDRVIAKENPYWLFVENEEMPDKKGYYRPIYNEGQDGSPEQMITWASIWKGGPNWDGMLDMVDGKLAIQRYTEPVYRIMPKALLVNRWNYPLAWLEQPQEGVSRNKSTHIEPNVDWGFKIFNAVATEIYKLNDFKQAAPPSPAVSDYDGKKRVVNISVDGFPLEYRVSNSKDFKDSEWKFINITDGGIKIADQIKMASQIYIQTRNSFGESAITPYKASAADLKEEVPEEKSEPGVTYIKTAEDLSNMQGNGVYKLMATIDLSGTEWMPIMGFKGEFDGNSSKGFSIKNLNGKACNGLFLVLEEGSIVKNLVIQNANIEAAGPMSGVIATKLNRGTIENCAVINSKIHGSNFVGGIVGVNDHATITGTFMTGEIYATDGTVGGIAGYSEFGKNDSCYFSGKIECAAGDNIGGIGGKVLGNNDGEGISNCYVTGTIKASAACKNVGGIVGLPTNDDGSWPAHIINNFALLQEITGGNTGRISSVTTNKLSNNFALDSIKVATLEIGDAAKDGDIITPKQAANYSTYVNSGWDSAVWAMGTKGLPVLKWLDKTLQ